MELNEVKIEASDGCNDFDELKSSTIKVSSDTKTSKSTGNFTYAIISMINF